MTDFDALFPKTIAGRYLPERQHHQRMKLAQDIMWVCESSCRVASKVAKDKFFKLPLYKRILIALTCKPW